MLYILRLAANTFQQAFNIVFQFLAWNHFQQIHNPSLTSRTMKNIVILGGSYAGVSTAHRILKKSVKAGPFKITLVSPNTHLYWNVASPRGIVPGQLTDEMLFQPIAAGFIQYPASQFEFILGSAESLDVEAKRVGISGSTDNKTLDYDFLILATGSHTNGDTPFKGLGSTEATKDALHDFQARVNKAETIVIAGAGVTGVEAAGELGFEYGRQKEIILVSLSPFGSPPRNTAVAFLSAYSDLLTVWQIASGPKVLEEAPASVSKVATEELQNLKVDIRLQTKVVGSTVMPNGRQELTLSGGDILITDMYIPTFGLIPNSSYIPAKFLNANGYVTVDEYLKVKGAEDVWAIGDVSDVEASQFITCDRQSAYAARNMTFILSNKTPLPYKAITSRMATSLLLSWSFG